MNKEMSREDVEYKQFALNACKDFGYGEKYIKRIKDSTDANEISRIMTTARNAE